MSNQSPPPAAGLPSSAPLPAARRIDRTVLRLLLVISLVGLAAGAWVWSGGAWLRGGPVRRHLAAGMEDATQGLGPQAEGEWKEALRLDPNSADACRLLAAYYFSARDWARALAALGRLRALAPGEPHVDCRLAACYLSLGDEVHALQWARHEIRRDPNCVAALATSAILLGRMGEEARAVPQLRRLVRLQPDDPDLQYMLAEDLTDTFAYQEARPVLERVIRLVPNHADAYAELGRGWLDDASVPDHLDRAQQALRQALALNPLNAPARLALGRLDLVRNQPRAAVPQLEEALRLMPHSVEVPFQLAAAYDRTGQPAQAAAMRRRFLTLRGLSTEVSTLQKRQALRPTVFDYPYRLGVIELQRGNYQRSFVWLNRAQSLRPHDPRVNAALAQLSRITAGPSRMAAAQERLVRAAVSGPAAPVGPSAAASQP